jgi:hypothetical protein
VCHGCCRPDAPRFGEIMDAAKQQQAVRSQNRVLHILGGRHGP